MKYYYHPRIGRCGTLITTMKESSVQRDDDDGSANCTLRQEILKINRTTAQQLQTATVTRSCAFMESNAAYNQALHTARKTREPVACRTLLKRAQAERRNIFNTALEEYDIAVEWIHMEASRARNQVLCHERNGACGTCLICTEYGVKKSNDDQPKEDYDCPLSTETMDLFGRKEHEERTPLQGLMATIEQCRIEFQARLRRMQGQRGSTPSKGAETTTTRENCTKKHEKNLESQGASGTPKIRSRRNRRSRLIAKNPEAIVDGNPSEAAVDHVAQTRVPPKTKPKTTSTTTSSSSSRDPEIPVRCPSRADECHDCVAPLVGHECAICGENAAICIALPCQHMIYCVHCARSECCENTCGDQQPKTRGQVACSECGQEVHAISRVFMDAQCVICLDEPPCSVYLPCLHMSCCHACSTQQQQAAVPTALDGELVTNARCAKCRDYIQKVARIFPA